MRYRPFGRHGAAASAISLALTDEPMRDAARQKLIYAALEAGINTFELRTPDPAIAAVLDDALGAVERSMVLVGVRVGWSVDKRNATIRDLEPSGVGGLVESLLARTRLGYFDFAVLDVAEDERLPPHVIPGLHNARDAGQVRLVGVSGANAADPYLGTTDFDALVTPFNLQSGWIERNRLRRAADADMPIIGCGYHPRDLGGEASEPLAPVRTGLSRWLAKSSAAPAARIPSAYDFMRRAIGWTPEQICLAYALTEPSLATIQTTETDPDALTELAAVAERDLPNGLAAQIEMARISDIPKRAALANRRPEA